jgi:hypothetical protein
VTGQIPAARAVTIKVSWRRVISIAPYETETLELGVEDQVNLSEGAHRDTFAAQWTAKYYQALCVEGDKLTIERLRKAGKK